MAAAKQVIVTVREGAIVYHDGRVHAAGRQIEVTVAEAKALREQSVIGVGRRRRPKRPSRHRLRNTVG